MFCSLLSRFLLAGVVTLEICVLIGMPLNFANIIALPLLLGVGVAFKIYYIMAWRSGRTDLLQSSLTRAVIWSALTTATAFGSLWLSQHPGHIEHGQAAGVVVSLHSGSGGAISARAHGKAPQSQALLSTHHRSARAGCRLSCGGLDRFVGARGVEAVAGAIRRIDAGPVFPAAQKSKESTPARAEYSDPPG